MTMTKRTPPKKNEPADISQRKRFAEFAKAHGADDPRALDRAMSDVEDDAKEKRARRPKD